jgi:hypothetical protein
MWYRSPSLIFWIITASLLVTFALERLGRATPSLTVVRWAPLGATLLMLAAAVYLFARSIGFVSELYASRYEAAQWIAANSPPDTVFAAWNTGQLGYFSNRTFINLDGVINSVDYYERVLRGSVPLADYLAENDVAYLVDYSTYGATPDYPAVRAFPINDGTGRAIQIWPTSPPLSPTP